MKNKKIMIFLCLIILIGIIIFAVYKYSDKKQENEEKQSEEEILQVSNTTDENAEELIGDGSKENPYLIQSIEDLVLISRGINNGTIGKGKIYSLETDLDFKSKNSYVEPDKTNFLELGDINQNNEVETLYQELTTGTGFIPIGKNEQTPFSGEIIGNGHTISNLYCKNARIYSGLIGIVSSNENEETKISNITIKDVNVEGNSAGALIGYCYQSSNVIIDNCNVIDGNIKAGGGAGGFIGEAYNTNLNITQCKNTAKITGTIVGGMIGIAPTNIEVQNCYNEADVKGDFYAGGIIGDGYSSTNLIIKKCYNSGKITGNVSAGIVCSKKADIEDTFNLGKIDGENLGAIVSNSDTENVSININNCFYLRGTCGRGIKGIEDITGKVDSVTEEEMNNKIVTIHN